MSDPKFTIDSASIVVRMGDGSMRSVELQDDERERLTVDISVSANEVDISQFTRSADRAVLATGTVADIHLRGNIASHLEKHGAQALWRFDVPVIPAHVTAFRDESDRVWLRLANDQWALADWDPEYIRWCEKHAAEGHKTGYPLVDVLDSAPLVECEDPRGAQ